MESIPCPEGWIRFTCVKQAHTGTTCSKRHQWCKLRASPSTLLLTTKGSPVPIPKPDPNLHVHGDHPSPLSVLTAGAEDGHPPLLCNHLTRHHG